MNKLPDNPSRAEVLSFISRSASYGNLGSFIGAGFSKAVLNDGINDIALSWGELLDAVAKSLNVDYEGIRKEGVGFPEIASRICEIYSTTEEIDYSRAVQSVKQGIAGLTSWHPDRDQRKAYSGYMSILNCSWIITTNYDLVIESLLTGASIPLGPNDSLTAPVGVVPVFHLHGVRTNPDEIIIVQEDYVGLFRPTEYRQIKLALMIKESTMLILGYGLGDVNVLTALDWSKNVFKAEPKNYPNEVIQVVRKENPREDTYRDRNSIVVLEASSLQNFFEEYSEARLIEIAKDKEIQGNLAKLSEELDSPDESMIEKFIDDGTYRAQVLKKLSTFPNDLVSGFISFLNRCIDETWTRSEPSRNFKGYADNLSMILDILTTFSIKQMPPALFETAAYALQRVGRYVGDNLGQSFEANRVWNQRKKELSADMVSELTAFSKQHGYAHLKDLCQTIRLQ
jgi:hypothetical protein